MKILITTDLYATATNGVVTSVQNLTEELRQKGHDVRILTISDKSKSYRDGLIYYIRSMPIGVYPDLRMPTSYRHHLIKDLIDWKPDIIHSQCEFFSFQFALRISKMTRAPIVHTYHTLYEQYVTYVIPFKSLGRYLVRVLSRKRLKRVQTIVASTHKVENTLIGYGIDNPIYVVPSGISMTHHKMRITPEERAKKRKALGISDHQPVLINLGRLGAEKNLEELLVFFSSALKINNNMVFLIVGDGPARTQLQELSKSLGISNQVIFTGMVSPKDVPTYYQIGDMFVSASISETQGLTYIEAAANGLPLLCRKDTCLDNVINHGENGYIYTCEEEFLNGINAFFENPEWRISAGKKSEKIAGAFDTKTFGTAIETIYESIL